jgi:hypothetical protein
LPVHDQTAGPGEGIAYGLEEKTFVSLISSNLNEGTYPLALTPVLVHLCRSPPLCDILTDRRSEPKNCNQEHKSRTLQEIIFKYYFHEL